MKKEVVKPTNHAMIRLQERFPREWKQMGFENCHKSTLHLSYTNLKLIAGLYARAKKVNSLINDKAMAVYCMERFGCPDPQFYVVDNIVFVMRDNFIITVMDKQLDARNHIKGFDSASSKKKKTVEDKSSDKLYITEGSFLRLIKEQNPLLTYTHICEYSKDYDVVLAAYRDKEMYYLQAKTTSSKESVLFFKTTAEKHQLDLIKAWVTALATHDDPMYHWVRSGDAALQLKYTSNIWVYTIDFERTTLTFSWNPVIQKGAILDFPIHSQSMHGVYINMNNYKYIKMAATGEAHQICAVAYNRYLYRAEDFDKAGETVYFVHEPGTSYWHELVKGTALYSLMTQMESTILPWVVGAIESDEFNVYKRVQRQTETYLFNSGEDGAREYEIKKTITYTNDGEELHTWQISPLMAYYIYHDHLSMPSSLSKSQAFQSVLEYAIQLQHDKRAYSVVDNEGQHPICSVEIGGLEYFYKVKPSEMHQVYKVYDEDKQPILRTLYQNINLIKAQLNSWIESGRAIMIRCDSTSTVVGVLFDGHFFIFQKLQGHSNFVAVSPEEEMYHKYYDWYQSLTTALIVSPTTAVLTYIKKAKRTRVLTLDVATFQKRFYSFYSKWSKDTEGLWREGLPPLYLIETEGEPVRMATRGEYGEIVQHEVAAKSLLNQLDQLEYESIEVSDSTKGHLPASVSLESEEAKKLIMLKVKLPPDREILLSVDPRSEALQASREDFMVMAHWHRHFP